MEAASYRWFAVRVKRESVIQDAWGRISMKPA
jgi:hypothetical protein